jgi:hypothetical protein
LTGGRQVRVRLTVNPLGELFRLPKPALLKRASRRNKEAAEAKKKPNPVALKETRAKEKRLSQKNEIGSDPPWIGRKIVPA